VPFLLTALVAFVLHLALGWVWTPVAAFTGGWARPRGAAWRGAGALVLAWGTFVAWTFVVDTAGASRAAGLLAGVLGGLPGVATVLLTLAVAALLGALAGTAGAAARTLTSSSHPRHLADRRPPTADSRPT
jgi:hypothetical protein